MDRFTLENYFQLHDGKVIDFRLRVQKDQNNQYSFYIHPQDVDGETWDFKVIGNFLECTTSTSETLNSLLVDSDTLSNLDKNVLFLLIKQVANKVNKLETDITNPLDQENLLEILNALNTKMSEMIQVNGFRHMILEKLEERIQELEQFQREYETAQEYERDRS